DLPPGSYLLLLTAPGRPPVRYPLRLSRGERLAVSVPLPAAVPAGYAYVPPGRFLYGAGGDEALRRLYGTVQPPHEVRPAGFLLGRREVTFPEWPRHPR